MATPFFQVQTAGKQVIIDQPATLTFPSLDASGNPIDLSSGYTIKKAEMSASASPNPLATPVDVSAIGTFTFTTTGLNWVLSTGEELSLFQGCISTLMQLAITISNDGGTTKSLLVNAPVTLVNLLNGAFNY